MYRYNWFGRFGICICFYIHAIQLDYNSTNTLDSDVIAGCLIEKY